MAAAASSRQLAVLLSILLGTGGILSACGGGGSSDAPSGSAQPSSQASSSPGASSAATSSSSSLVAASSTCPAITLSATDAASFTGSSTPLQLADYYRYDSSGTKNPKILSFQVINKLHGYKYIAAPVLPTWQFATTDPTNGVLSDLECSVAPDTGWHNYVRASGTASTITHSKVVVTGGRNAAKENIYTVYNGQQLLAALAEAGLKPKIIRVVGHIDLRWRENNTKFEEYISYTDQKYGGSINIPSNTTLVGINDAAGNPARITGTSLLIGGELGTTTDIMAGASGDPETDFKKWIALGKDGDLYPTWTRNVIIRNLKLDTPWDVDPEDSGNGYADGVTVSRAQNVWIDHLTLTDGDTPDSLASDTRHDGNLDIVRGSDYVTVANTFFGDHGKNSLVGNGDAGRAWSDQGRLHVTYTGLWWRGIASRHPLVRFGQLHTFNNLMQGTTDTAPYGHKFEGGLDVRYTSDVLSENNFHLFTYMKAKEVCGKLVKDGSDGSGFRTSGNYFISDKDDNGKTWATTWTNGGPTNVDSLIKPCPGIAEGSWTPPYPYSLVCAAQARRNIEINTGAGRIGSNAKLGSSTDTVSSTSCYSENVYAASSTSSSASSAAASSAASSSGSTSSAAASSAASTSLISSWSTTDFSSATTATLLTTSFATLPGDASKPMYLVTSTSKAPTVASGSVTLPASTYLMIGALANTATTSSSTPGGVFNVASKSCTLTLTVTTALDSAAGGHFIVLVDNNTSSSGNSLLGSASKVVDVTSLAAGTQQFTWAQGSGNTQGSFITLRTDSKASIAFSSLSLSCN